MRGVAGYARWVRRHRAAQSCRRPRVSSTRKVGDEGDVSGSAVAKADFAGLQSAAIATSPIRPLREISRSVAHVMAQAKSTSKGYNRTRSSKSMERSAGLGHRERPDIKACSD